MPSGLSARCQSSACRSISPVVRQACNVPRRNQLLAVMAGPTVGANSKGFRSAWRSSNRWAIVSAGANQPRPLFTQQPTLLCTAANAALGHEETHAPQQGRPQRANGSRLVVPISASVAQEEGSTSHGRGRRFNPYSAHQQQRRYFLHFMPMTSHMKGAARPFQLDAFLWRRLNPSRISKASR